MLFHLCNKCIRDISRGHNVSFIYRGSTVVYIMVLMVLQLLSCANVYRYCHCQV